MHSGVARTETSVNRKRIALSTPEPPQPRGRRGVLHPRPTPLTMVSRCGQLKYQIVSALPARLAMRFPHLFQPGRIGSLEVPQPHHRLADGAQLLHGRRTRHAALHRLHGGPRARRSRAALHRGHLRRSARQGADVADGALRRRPRPRFRAAGQGGPSPWRRHRARAQLRRPRGPAVDQRARDPARPRSCPTRGPAGSLPARWIAGRSRRSSSALPMRPAARRRPVATSSASTARTAIC